MVIAQWGLCIPSEDFVKGVWVVVLAMINVYHASILSALTKVSKTSREYTCTGFEPSLKEIGMWLD